LKKYLFTISLAVGSSHFDPEQHSEVFYATSRATLFPQLQICFSFLQAEPSCSGEKGFIPQQHAKILYEHFVKNSVDSSRIHFDFPQASSAGNRSEFSPRLEIHLYPKIASLNGDGKILTHREAFALEAAWEISLYPEGRYKDEKRKSVTQFSAEDWQRIIGFETIGEWQSYGAKHPYYDANPFMPYHVRLRSYSYSISYPRGSCSFDPKNQSIIQPIWRAANWPDCPICFFAHEDSSDPDDVGLAMPRAKKLHDHFVKNSVDSHRIYFEFAEASEVGSGTDFARRLEIHLYPRIISLNGDGQILRPREVYALDTAREIVLHPERPNTEYHRKRLAPFSAADWRRIIGFDSLEEWENKGASHPYYAI